MIATPILASQILHYHRAKNDVIGDDTFLRGLQAFAYQTAHNSIANFSRVAYLKGVVSQCESEISSLINGAETDQQRLAILPQVRVLKEAADNALSEMELLNG